MSRSALRWIAGSYLLASALLVGGCGESSFPASPLPDVAPSQRVTVTNDRSAGAERRMNVLDDGSVLIGEDTGNHTNNMMWR